MAAANPIEVDSVTLHSGQLTSKEQSRLLLQLQPAVHNGVQESVAMMEPKRTNSASSILESFEKFVVRSGHFCLEANQVVEVPVIS